MSESANSDSASKPAVAVLAAGMAKRYGGCKPLAPLGVNGEAVIDLIVGDAISAGFGDVVLILGPQTGPAIRYHVEQNWPKSLNVSFAIQPVPLGTAHALLCAHSKLGDRPFAVVNGDDVYGAGPLGLLASQLASQGSSHALVSFPLADSIVTDSPVTRGTCSIDPDSNLIEIVERRKVSRSGPTDFESGDGLDPVKLDPAGPVSMNLWGLHPSVWPVLEEAVLQKHPDVAADGSMAEAGPASADEVLLPEVVADMVAGKVIGGAQPVKVIPGSGRCIGVTHADDLPVAKAELAGLVGRGIRPEDPWSSIR